jgi:hypothetical protein
MALRTRGPNSFSTHFLGKQGSLGGQQNTYHNLRISVESAYRMSLGEELRHFAIDLARCDIIPAYPVLLTRTGEEDPWTST